MRCIGRSTSIAYGVYRRGYDIINERESSNRSDGTINAFGMVLRATQVQEDKGFRATQDRAVEVRARIAHGGPQPLISVPEYSRSI